MIAEERVDLISRKELYQLVVKKMNQQYNGATLNSALTLKEILEIFHELPVYNEISAEWVKDNETGTWHCNSCKMDNYSGLTSRYCPYCGRRMKVRI